MDERLRNDPAGTADNKAILAEGALGKHLERQVKVTQGIRRRTRGRPDLPCKCARKNEAWDHAVFANPKPSGTFVSTR